MPAIDVNIRRVLERVRGRRLTTTEAERAMVEVARPLRARDRLLALMDVGALLCRPRGPALLRVSLPAAVRDTRSACRTTGGRASRRSRGASDSGGDA